MPQFVDVPKINLIYSLIVFPDMICLHLERLMLIVISLVSFDLQILLLFGHFFTFDVLNIDVLYSLNALENIVKAILESLEGGLCHLL